MSILFKGKKYISKRNIFSEKLFSFLWITLVSVFLTLFFIIYLPTQAQAAPIELKIGNQDPPVHHSHGNLVDWAKKVEEQTNGMVKFKIFPSGQLAPAPKIYQGLLKGVMDVGRFAEGFTPQLFPLNYGSVFNIMGAPNAVAATRIRLDLFKKFQELRDEYKDVHVLFMYSTPAVNIHTTFPAHNLKDLEGKQIRVPGGMVDLAKVLGTYPYTSRMDETYLALSKGIVDGLISSNETLKSFKLAEVTKHTTITNISSSPYAIVMNKKVWDSLPPEAQKVIDGLKEWASIEMAKGTDAAGAEAMDFAKSLGHEFIEPPPQVLEEIYSRISTLHQAWASDMEAKGLPGKAILGEISTLLKKYSTK